MKKLFTLGLLLFLFSTKSICQQIVWQKTIGGSGNDYLSDILQTPDAGFVIIGSSYSNISGDKTENNWDTTIITRDYWVMKIDSVGNIVWQNTIGGTKDDFTAEIKATYDGGYIIGGTSISEMSGDKSENGCNASYDYWIVKIDSIGNIEWQNTIGAPVKENLSSIFQVLDGGYIIGGNPTSNLGWIRPITMELRLTLMTIGL
ncbi:MAG: hypothetical protein IPP29_21920 [Bacteroidetes bacterium]|nr:hypothetical protein [Bacteroidota bacterium]